MNGSSDAEEAPVKVLIADDDHDLLAVIGFTLQQARFDVRTARDGKSALRCFAQDPASIVLLDINMPPPDGLQVCREIRRHSNVPIMMLTVRDGEEDVVDALESGADDHVCKPFSPRALLARIRALLRRCEAVSTPVIAVGDVRLDLEELTLHIGGARQLRLTPLELRALHLLVVNAGRTVSAERLLNHIWGTATVRARRSLKQLIYRLRRKVEHDPATPQVLQTTPGAGYRLMVDPLGDQQEQGAPLSV